MNIYIYMVSLLCFVLVGCNYSEDKQNSVLSNLNTVDTCSFSSSFIAEIKTYLNQHESSDLFIIKSTMLCEYNGFTDCGVDNEIYVICPATLSNSVGEGEFYFIKYYPSAYFKVNNKIILFSTTLDKWTEQKKIKYIYSKLNNMCNTSKITKKEKKYFIVWFTKDSTQIMSEKEFILNNKLIPIIEQHKTLDTTFVAPKL